MPCRPAPCSPTRRQDLTAAFTAWAQAAQALAGALEAEYHDRHPKFRGLLDEVARQARWLAGRMAATAAAGGFPDEHGADAEPGQPGRNSQAEAAAAPGASAAPARAGQPGADHPGTPPPDRAGQPPGPDGATGDETGLPEEETEWQQAARRLARLPADEIPAAVAALPARDLGEIRDILGYHFPELGSDLGPNAEIAYEACTRRMDGQDEPGLARPAARQDRPIRPQPRGTARPSRRRGRAQPA